jgi:protein-tyrosine phosphatase
MENLHLKKFLYEDITNPNKKIVIYDEPPVQNDEITLSIHGALNKFLRYEDYNGKLYVLGDGFQSFKGQYPELLDAEEHEDLGQSPTLPLLQTSRHFHSLSDASSKSLPLLPPGSISLSDLSASSLSSLESSSGLLSASVSFTNTSSTSSPISPNLSRFHLPKLPKTPIFKIRHNEESYDFHNYKVLHEFKYLNATTSTEVQKLPQWLQNLLPSLKENVDEQAHNPLIEKFKILEMDEKKRINDMISSNSIGYGIELGSKNRYKDIFPYEHSRVKLSSTPTSEVSHEFDLDQSNLNYINANFISSPNLTDIKYIATQAPLNGTLKDFNKLIRDNNIEIIIALTNQFENGVEKCYPYWKDTSYYQIIEEEKLPNIIIRRLKITNYDIGKEIIQIQILNWLDYDIMVNSQQDDVLKLIFFKRFIMERLNIWNENVLVHCSAGCGRTGTFCTLDTIINVDDHRHDESLLEKNEDVAFDPVFNIVENFRNQRISMVQNLRQYLFIYDCLCNYFENFQQFEKFHTEFKDLTILNNFIQQRVCHEEK